jgi:hypothetical protein
MTTNESFEKFIEEIISLIGSPVYFKTVVKSEDLIIFDFKNRSISAFKTLDNITYGFWNLDLNQEIIVNHFENECNIYEENGIIGLVDLFVSAIMGNISFYINHNDNKNLSLRLEYNIGHKIEGLLNLPFVQFNIDRVLFTSIESLSICHKPFKIINAGIYLYANILII